MTKTLLLLLLAATLCGAATLDQNTVPLIAPEGNSTGSCDPLFGNAFLCRYQGWSHTINLNTVQSTYDWTDFPDFADPSDPWLGGYVNAAVVENLTRYRGSSLSLGSVAAGIFTSLSFTWTDSSYFSYLFHPLQDLLFLSGGQGHRFEYEADAGVWTSDCNVDPCHSTDRGVTISGGREVDSWWWLDLDLGSGTVLDSGTGNGLYAWGPTLTPFNYDSAPVPEPGTLGLAMIALLFGAWQWRRQRVHI